MPAENYKKLTIGLIIIIFVGVVILAVTTSDHRKEGATPAQRGPVTGGPAMGQNVQRPLELPETLPEDPRELADLGDKFFESGAYDKAVIIYGKVIEKNPNDIDTYNDMGLALYYTGRTSEAVSILKKGTEVSPSYQRVWLSLGFILKAAGNDGEAKNALQKAAEINPQNDVGQEAVKMLQTIK